MTDSVSTLSRSARKLATPALSDRARDVFRHIVEAYVETGEPIGLKRLDARPIATLSIEAQERHERREKVYRDE